ncbi:MAG: N-acetylglucosamine-6-phosphate deacetylase [Oscillospiraceae bacterium]|nr:N-acetylglucosamine-6-phosphate deacetylase [Oscillospiraceae bacterium]
MKIKLGKTYSSGKLLNEKCVEISNGKFSGFCSGEEYDMDLSSYIIFPGFIDMHTHGGIGIEANSASFDDLDRLSEFYASNGVAEFCVTTVTDSIENLINIEHLVSRRISEGTKGANIAGVYLEGPYLSHEYRGAHEEALLAAPNREDIDRLVAASDGNLRVLAVAPEIEGALDAIVYAKSKGIKVSAGHSAANCDEAMAGFDSGADIAIHTYNAMRGLNHREPGFLGAALARDDVYAELICDFVHARPEACKIAIKCKGKDKIIYITDSLGTAGLPDGEYKFGPLPVFVKGGVARIAEGNLAGSSLRLNTAIKNVVEILGIPVEDAMLGVTKNPAEALGMFDKIGSIDPGKRAHLTVLDDGFNVVMTIVDGKIAYKA